MGDIIYLIIAVICFVIAIVTSLVIILLRINEKRMNNLKESKVPQEDRTRWLNEKKSIFIAPNYKCREAQSIEAVRVLIEQGYEYVCDVNGVKVFRKRM
jgi:hypothetical protein